MFFKIHLFEIHPKSVQAWKVYHHYTHHTHKMPYIFAVTYSKRKINPTCECTRFFFKYIVHFVFNLKSLQDEKFIIKYFLSLAVCAVAPFGRYDIMQLCISGTSANNISSPRPPNRHHHHHHHTPSHHQLVCFVAKQ